MQKAYFPRVELYGSDAVFLFNDGCWEDEVAHKMSSTVMLNGDIFVHLK